MEGYQNQLHLSMSNLYPNSFREDRMDFLEGSFHTTQQGNEAYEVNKLNTNNSVIDFHSTCSIEQSRNINQNPNIINQKNTVAETVQQTNENIEVESQLVRAVIENSSVPQNINSQQIETCQNNNFSNVATENRTENHPITSTEKSPDDELKELLGDENETLSVPFTVIEVKKLAKQKLKKAGNKTRLQKRQIKIDLVRKVQETDYRKMIRIRWKVKKLYKQMKEKNPDYELPDLPSKNNKTSTQEEINVQNNTVRVSGIENDFDVIKGLKSKKDKYTEWRRKRMSDPEYRDMIRAKDNAQRRKKRQMERQKAQKSNTKLKTMRARDNAKRRERLKDPEYRAMTQARDNATRKFRRQLASKKANLKKIRQSESRARRREEDPEYKAFLTNQDAASRKVRRQDPAYRQAERFRDNASRRNRRKDPQYRKKEAERLKNNQQDNSEKVRSKAVENIQKILDTNLGTFKGPPEMVLETLDNSNRKGEDSSTQPSAPTTHIDIPSILLNEEKNDNKTLEEEFEEIYEVQTI